MKRSVLAGICAVITGNAVITIFEKLVYSSAHLNQLHEVLVYGGTYANKAALFPPELLFQKMMAWVCAAFTAGLAIAAFKPVHSMYVKGAVILFFILAALVNVTIVPHPGWLAASIPALFIVPLLAGTRLPGLLKQLNTAAIPQHRGQTQSSPGMQPAAV